MDGILGLHGWQWLFIVIGTPAILLTWPVLRYLPDGPKQVKWMTDAEKPGLTDELNKDLQAYGQTRHGNPLHALKDTRVSAAGAVLPAGDPEHLRPGLVAAHADQAVRRQRSHHRLHIGGAVYLRHHRFADYPAQFRPPE